MSIYHKRYQKCFERRTTMMPNYYDHERLAQAHRQDLLREAEHERMLAQLPQANGHILDALVRLRVSLRVLRIRLGKRLHRQIA
jgi:hypothetical protein